MLGIARIAWKLPAIGIGLSAVALSLMALPRSPRRDELVRLLVKALTVVMGLQIKARLHGRPSRLRYILANHVSYLDIFLIASLFPTGFLAKTEVSRWPFIGRLARLGDTVFVRRDCMASRFRALKALARPSAKPYTIFPEGTTSRHPVPDHKTWHRGHAYLSRVAPQEIYALGIYYRDQGDIAWIDDQALVPHLLRMLMRRRIEVWVEGDTIGKPPSSQLRDLPIFTYETVRDLCRSAIGQSQISETEKPKVAKAKDS